jgi:hypothetical protein
MNTNKEKITLEITIEKAKWLETSALIRRIKALDWPLATGGCSITSIEEKGQNGSTYESCGCVYRGNTQERTCETHMRTKDLCIPDQQKAEIKTEALNAIRALNKLILAGVRHENITNADFLVNTWFDANFDEEDR